MDNNGWIKIHRKLLEWEWADDPNMVALWIHLLLNANLTDKKYRGKTIPRGSFKTSLNELAEETGLSKQKLRTCLERLKSTHEITQQTTHKYSIITICKYDTYQLVEKKSNTPINTQGNIQATHEQHTSNTPIIEEGKKLITSYKKEKKEEKSDWDVLFDEWLEYKKQRKETYHSQLALDRMKTKLRNLSGNNIETARAIINEAMANNWAGFFALRANTTTPESKADRNQRNEEEAKKILGI